MMDLYVERQCVDNMKAGDTRQFLLLFDANFEDLYKYVARRVADVKKLDKIVRLTFLDALGQVSNTPTDVGYLTWLYSLAKPRVWDYIAKSSFPGQTGLITVSAEGREDDGDVVQNIDKVMKKLSLEEREILRLKFFEEVADGDLITILGIEEGKLGPKIYRVLKRAHFLLFGEDGEKKKVYFGKLSGLFEKLRALENIEVPEMLKLSLKADLTSRIERKDFAIKGEIVKEKVKEKAKGSDDPAKIFVEAVKEMKEEEEEAKAREAHKIERREGLYDFIDKWKGVLILVPLILFIWIFVLVALYLWGYLDGGVERGYVNSCGVEVSYEGTLSDAVRRGVDDGITNRLCDYFDVRAMSVVYSETGDVFVEVDVPDRLLEYRFVRKNEIWKIKKYARTPDSNEESG